MTSYETIEFLRWVLFIVIATFLVWYLVTRD
jgi:hypothetical protein